MSARNRAITLAMFVSFLVIGCGAIESTATPIPPTDTPLPSMATIIPPTPITQPSDTPLPPAPTRTSAPTNTPTPTPTATSPESAARPISFVNSGQRLGRARSWDVELGDLDGDGDLDAFVTNDGQDGRANAIWLNDGGMQGSTPGHFTSDEQNLGYGFSVALGDVDGDGDLDAMIVGESVNAAQVWLNSGGVQEGTPGILVDSGERLNSEGISWKPALGDLDGDGDLDVFMAIDGANMVWLNKGSRQGGKSGLFVDSGQRLGDLLSATVALGDVDGDGDLDALTGGAVELWLNDGLGAFTEKDQDQIRAISQVHGIALGDVDGDGDLDAIATAASGGASQVWLNDGRGQFATNQSFSTSLTHDVALGDLDGDGDLDAVIASGNMEDGSSQVLSNVRSGHFARGGAFLGYTFSSAVALGDLDGDGDLDAFVTHTNWQEGSGGEPNQVWFNETHPSAPQSGYEPAFEPAELSWPSNPIRSLSEQSPKRLYHIWRALTIERERIAMDPQLDYNRGRLHLNSRPIAPAHVKAIEGK
jgi:hypothetical protein